MRFLFVKEKLAWPRSSGHDVHSYYLMRALSHLGHEVHLATLQAVEPLALQGADIAGEHCFESVDATATATKTITLSKWQEKFRSYWGIPHARIQRVAQIAQEIEADVVSVVGLNVLPYLAGVKQEKKIWYAGDEWVWHHWSQFSFWKKSTWGELKQALTKGMYERAYAPMLDRVWMVSAADATSWKRVTGHRQVDILPNGIDVEHYQPLPTNKIPKSCVFWGRLDFGPNQQALAWFLQNVWRPLHLQHPQATFRIYGFQPTSMVQQLVAQAANVELIPNLPDIRDEIQQAEIAVMPFVSGGGIKNKLLEAAAMAMPIVATTRTMQGLNASDAVQTADRPKDWCRVIGQLWGEPQKQTALGKAAREWVIAEHSWESAAKLALQPLEVQAPLVAV